MPLKLSVKQKLLSRSDRVKCVDLHPSEKWMLTSLYNGNVHVWNYETMRLVKSIAVGDLPVRAAKFIPRKNWIITGSDDMQIRIYNYNTLEYHYAFHAHSDYIRSIVVHPTEPFVLTASDDMSIKLWKWSKKWTCTQVFDNHCHYIMQIVINPKDNNTFASASLDRTVKVWQLGSAYPNFTLEGHQKGVNCVNYYYGSDKPYLISGADDNTVKIWDYQNKTCIQTLEGHTQNISAVIFHPELPIIISGSEDGTVKLWHANTYSLENTLNYGFERLWGIAALQGSNDVALGYDEGCVLITLGRDEPAISMDCSGKIIYAKHAELQQANLKSMADTEIKDGESLPLQIKDLGSSELYPQFIYHSPNGRFIVIVGDGDYIIYTAMALRSKCFGTAKEFVWAWESSEYATRDNTSSVKIFKNFKEKMSFIPHYAAETIFGGYLLGVNSIDYLTFYEWESALLIQRIEIQPKHVFWSESGEFVCIASHETFYILHYDTKAAVKAKATEKEVDDAFEVKHQVQDCVKTGLWVGDCFIYTNSVNRLSYHVGGENVTIAHLDRLMYLLGYIPKDNRLFLCDKELNTVSYSLHLSVLEYQTLVMRGDLKAAESVLPFVPGDQRTRIAQFLEKQGFKSEALDITTDPDHKYDLALQLEKWEIAYDLAKDGESQIKWKQLAGLAMTHCRFELAEKCMMQAEDYEGLLLLATSSGSGSLMEKLAQEAEKNGKNNVAFIAYLMFGKKEKALNLLLKTGRIPEAAFFVRTYMPGQVSNIVNLWKENFKTVNKTATVALADPEKYENLFPMLSDAIKTEHYVKQNLIQYPASVYLEVSNSGGRNFIDEMKEAESSGKLESIDAPNNVDDGTQNPYSLL